MSKFAVLVVFITLCASSLARAQEFPELPAPQKEHEWLKQFVGEWETHSEAVMGPGQPAIKCEGTMNADVGRVLGRVRNED